MKRWFDKIAVYTRKLRTQLFLTYFIVFAFFFLAVFLLASGSIRDLMVDQIGNNRTAVLQQIAERADIVKTSSTTLSNLYSHEIESNGFLDSVLTDRQKEEAADYLNSRKKIYDEVFRHIGLGFEVVLMGGAQLPELLETAPYARWWEAPLRLLAVCARCWVWLWTEGDGFQIALALLLWFCIGWALCLLLRIRRANRTP